MNKAFEQIGQIPGVVAAAFLAPDGTLSGSCANSAIANDTLAMIGATCRAVLSSSRAEKREARTGAAAFGARTLVFREGDAGLFFAYLDSPVDDAVLDWFFAQIKSLLAGEGIVLE